MAERRRASGAGSRDRYSANAGASRRPSFPRLGVVRPLLAAAMLQKVLVGAVLSALALASLPAQAAPYVTMRDPDGDVAVDDNTPNIATWRAKVLAGYEALGFPIPEVLSIWTAFPMAGNNYSTYIDPRAADVMGIGLEQFFPPDGIQESTKPPLRALLWHNNVLAMQARADLHDAPVAGYARYLFLLELSHLWGPALRAPAPGEFDLIGFPYHWSFFNDLASPAGGNVWTDNGDGTFTVTPGDPATLSFSMLDLYVMGLATPAEVPPFGVLTNVVVPPTPTDPFWGGAYAARSFPWFDAQGPALTVTATRRSLTIDDVIAANGPRDPVAGTKDTWTVGIVLLVGADATDAEVAAAEAAFDPIAESLAPGFSDATMGRGTLEIVTLVEEGGGGGGGGAGAGGGASSTSSSGSGGGAPDDAPADEGCDCRTAGAPATGGGWVLALGLALAARRRPRERGSFRR